MSAPEGVPWPVRLGRRIPPVVLEQPWAIFVNILCILSGLTTFVGPAPGTISEALPPILVYTWSGILVLGSATALFGLLRPNRKIVEMAGLLWLGTAALVYSVAIAQNFGAGGAIPAGIVLAFALAALVRCLAVYLAYEIARRVVSEE